MRGLLKKQKRFCITALIWGLLFTFLIPLWQVPDEYEHVEMIGQEIKNGNLAAIMMEEVPLEEHRIRWNPEERIELETLGDAMVKKAEYQKSACLPGGITITVLRHLPATLGMILGILFGLPAYWVMITGRLFSLAFYISICAISLELMPLEKELLEIIMLLPMCIQEAASLSYDAVLLPMSFLVVAHLLYLKFTAVEAGLRDVVVMVCILFWIAVIKPPYVVLGGLSIMIPVQKIHIKIGRCEITGDWIRKLRWAVLPAAIIVLYLLRNNIWVKLIAATFRHFYRTMWLFGRTCKVWGSHIFESMVGRFGYFDARTATWFMAAVAAFVLVIAMTELQREGNQKVSGIQLTIKDRVLMYIVLGVCFYLVTTSMISFSAGYHTLDWDRALFEITEINGLQGRYYIPMLMLFLLPLPRILEMKEQIFRKVIVVFYVFACVYTCGVLCFRYWSV